MELEFLDRIVNFIDSMSSNSQSLSIPILLMIIVSSLILSIVRTYYMSKRSREKHEGAAADKALIAIVFTIFLSLLVNIKDQSLRNAFIFIIVLMSPIVSEFLYVFIYALKNKFMETKGLNKYAPTIVDKEDIDTKVEETIKSKEGLEAINSLQHIKNKEDLVELVEKMGLEAYTNPHHLENPNFNDLIDLAIIYQYVTPRQLENALEQRLFRNDVKLEDFLGNTVLNEDELKEIKVIRQYIMIKGGLPTREELNRVDSTMLMESDENKKEGGD